MASSTISLPLSFLGKGRHSLDAVPGSLSLLELPRFLRAPVSFLHRRCERHGRIFKTRLVHPVVFVAGADAVGIAEETTHEDHEHILFGDGRARAARELFGDAATRERLLAATTSPVSTLWARALARAADGTRRDVGDLAARTALDAAAHALAGFELGEVPHIRDDLEHMAYGVLAATRVRVPFGAIDRAASARARLVEALIARVAEARIRDHGGRLGRSLLGELARFRDPEDRPLPAEAIADHVLVVLYAAYAAGATAAAWALHVLARRLDWQERLADESKRVLDGRPVTPELAAELPDTGLFAREVERMHPAALFVPRIAAHDLEHGGVTIPAGTAVYLSAFMAQRDPVRFQHPNAFDPSRWQDDRPGPSMGDDVLLGLGRDPRIRFGEAFAHLELKVAVHELVRRFELEPEPRSPASAEYVPMHLPYASEAHIVPK